MGANKLGAGGAVLLVGGGESLQVAAVLTGGPFAALSLVALVGLTLAFRRHERDRDRARPTLLSRVRSAVTAAAGRSGRDDT